MEPFSKCTRTHIGPRWGLVSLLSERSVKTCSWCDKFYSIRTIKQGESWSPLILEAVLCFLFFPGRKDLNCLKEAFFFRSLVFWIILIFFNKSPESRLWHAEMCHPLFVIKTFSNHSAFWFSNFQFFFQFSNFLRTELLSKNTCLKNTVS